jgi:hypothetical protein
MNARLAGLGVLLLATALVPAPTLAADDQKTTAVPNFTGRWRLNKELSDKPQALPAPAPAPKKSDAKTGKEDANKEAKPDAPGHSDATKPDAKPPDPGAASQPPAEAIAEFTIRQTDVEVVAEDKPGQSRSFYPNGRTYKADEGASTIKSEWRDGALVFEKRNVRGWKYTESWKLTPDGRLRLDTRIEGGGQKTAASKRLYDRVTDAK